MFLPIATALVARSTREHCQGLNAFVLVECTRRTAAAVAAVADGLGPQVHVIVSMQRVGRHGGVCGGTQHGGITRRNTTSDRTKTVLFCLI